MASGVLRILVASKRSPKAAEIKAAFPKAFMILHHAAEGWENGEIVAKGVSTECMKKTKQGVFSVSRKVGGRLIVYIGMELLRSRDLTANLNDHCQMSGLRKLLANVRIAESIVHQTCRVGLGLSHSDALLAELLVSSAAEVKLPRRVERQLELSSREELFEILQRRDQELVHQLCLHTNCERDWDSLPSDVRSAYVKRASAEPYQVNEMLRRWIESNGCNQTYEAYLARRDLHVILSLRTYAYAKTLFQSSSQQALPPRRNVAPDFISRLEESIAGCERFGRVIGLPLLAFNWLRRWFQTVVKFFVLILIAEPEFQRELNCVLKRRWIRGLVMFLCTRIWIYCREIQCLILPFFMVVEVPLCMLIISFMAVRVSINLPIL